MIIAHGETVGGIIQRNLSPGRGGRKLTTVISVLRDVPKIKFQRRQ
jgi:hypothetical protein